MSLDKLRPYWDAAGCDRYLEPFAGSAANLFYLNPRVPLINDINADLTEFYRNLCGHGHQLYSLAVAMPSTPDKYYEVREAIKVERDSVKRSAMFYYLNRNCFNGIYRTNKKGEFNVPFSGKRSGVFPEWPDIAPSIEILKRTIVSNEDFSDFISNNVLPKDFVYLDPPYSVENRRVFSQYSPNSFGSIDIQRLNEVIYCIDAVGAKFLLSYAYCAESLELAKGWMAKRNTVQRNVAGFGKHRRRANELLITNIRGLGTFDE